MGERLLKIKNSKKIYQIFFQNYRKEAQKCYCEAPSCRGWLGEEPDEEEGEEYEEEEEENELTSEDQPIPETVKEEKVAETTSEEVLPKIEVEEAAPIPVVTTVKKTKPKRKLRKELFEDDVNPFYAQYYFSTNNLILCSSYSLPKI